MSIINKYKIGQDNTDNHYLGDFTANEWKDILYQGIPGTPVVTLWELVGTDEELVLGDVTFVRSGLIRVRFSVDGTFIVRVS